MKGKIVVITGGGTGIGKGAAIAFAQAGASAIAILGRRVDRLEKSKAEIQEAASEDTTIVIYEVADLAVPEQTQKAFQNISQKLGKIDILVNNAGAIAPPGPTAAATIDQLNAVLNANVLTTFNAVQAFLPNAAPRPMLVNITACLIHVQPLPMMGLYAAAKAAQTTIAEYFGAENPHVHVVHLHPGMVTTEIGGPVSEVKGPDDGKQCTNLSAR